MNIEVDPGSSRVLRFLAGVLLLIGIATGYQKLVRGDPPISSPIATPIMVHVGSGPQISDSDVNTSPQIELDSIDLNPISPQLGQVIKNPAHFEWRSTPSSYYAIEIRHTEQGKVYGNTSQWIQGGIYEINLPDQAIGNLEWRISATDSPPGGKLIQSNWYHFTFDPFVSNKERKEPQEGE